MHHILIIHVLRQQVFIELAVHSQDTVSEDVKVLVTVQRLFLVQMTDGTSDPQLLKGVLIALVLAVAWWTFVAVVLVCVFHVWGCDASNTASSPLS